MPQHILGKEPTNLTTLQNVFHTLSKYLYYIDVIISVLNVIANLGLQYKMDPTAVRFPYEDDITIFNQSRLMINVEGCVNTLQEECSNFYETHGNDGRNHSAPSRYPCFYSPNNPEFVVARYNLNQSRWLFLMFFIIPASLFILSCGVLFTCSRCLNVDNSGHMEMNCCHTDNNELSSSSQFKLDKDADAL